MYHQRPMNPAQDGGKTLRKRENSAKSGKVGMSASVVNLSNDAKEVATNSIVHRSSV